MSADPYKDQAACLISPSLQELFEVFEKSNRVEDLCNWLLEACPNSQVEFVKILTLDGNRIALDGRDTEAYLRIKKLIDLDTTFTPEN